MVALQKDKDRKKCVLFSCVRRDIEFFRGGKEKGGERKNILKADLIAETNSAENYFCIACYNERNFGFGERKR